MFILDLLKLKKPEKYITSIQRNYKYRQINIAILGGATVWPYAGISVFPEKGSAIFWHNTFTDADPDEYTQHTACPVLLGNKWIGNKWVGYNAQWNQLKCDLYPFVGFPAIASYAQ